MVPVGYLLENFLGARLSPALKSLFAGLLLMVAVAGLSCGAAHGQVAPLLKTDINTGAAGSYSFSSPTYTISGAGPGIGTAGSGAPGATDGFTFASFPVSGNMEIVGKLTGQSGTGLNNFSQAGLMIRSTMASNSQMFFVGASPTNGNGINFHARTAAGGTATSTLGLAPGAAPVWVRLVVSGQNVAAYQSSDSTNWVLVGQAKATLPAAFHAGLAVSSNQQSTTSTATFENVRILTNVPQRSADMLLWLRSDDGLQATDKLNRWLDSSSRGFHASNTGTNRPTVVTNAISGSPVVQFTPGNSEFLALPSGFNDFAQGASIYMVFKHAGSTVRDLLDLGTGPQIHDSILIEQVTNTEMQFVVGDSFGSYAVVSGTGFSTSGFQLLEATDSPYAEGEYSTGNLYRNGVLKGTNTAFVGVTPATVRTKNELGRSYLDTLYYSGQLAELIVINKEDSASARQQIERYCQSKYGFGSPAVLSAPVISPSNRVLTSGPVSITITADPGSAILYTTNGADPSPSTIGTDTSVYTGAFSTSSTVKVKAISVGINFANSAISSSDIQIDANASRIYKNDLKFWVRADNGVVLNGSTVSKLYDCSGGGHLFEQTNTAKQPTFQTGQTPAGLPAIDFPATNSQSLKSTSNFNSWTGASIFIVVNPLDTAPSGTPRMLDIGNGTSAQDNIGMSQPAANDYRFFAYDGTTVKNCTHTGGLTQSQFQLLSATTDNTALVATVFKNKVQGAQTSAFSVLQNVTRASNYIGANSAGSGPFKGKIAEIIVYSRKLTDAERLDVEGYLIGRHQLLPVSAPIITPSIGMNSPTTVSLTVDMGASAYYTLDGTAPTTNPPSGTTITYSSPFAINKPTRVRAKARNYSTDSAESEAYIAVDASAANVPRTGLQLWQRSDAGVVTTTGNPPPITTWKDILSTTRDAPSTNSPTLLSNILNGQPAVNVNATPSPQYFTHGGTFNFTGGFSAFIVSNITTPASTVDIATFTQTSPVRSVKIQATATPSLVYSVTNASTQSLTTGMTLGFPQLIEVVHSGSTATVFRNGAQLNSGSVAASTYTGGLTGQLSSSGAASTQQVFEVLCFDRAVTAQERQDIEAYLMQRYAIASAPVADPVFSVPSGTTFEAPTQISVAGPLNATIRFTTDGSSPTLSSPILTSPLNISFTQTVKAIAVLNDVASNIVSASYTLDSTRYPNPSAGGTAAPVLNLQLPTTGQ